MAEATFHKAFDKAREIVKQMQANLLENQAQNEHLTPADLTPSDDSQNHNHSPHQKLEGWAATCSSMVSQAASEGPQSAGAVHAPVAHDSTPHRHLYWFYGQRTPQEDTAEAYFHFKVWDRRTGAVVIERVPLATKLGMEFLFEDLRAVDSTEFIKHQLTKETIRMGKAYNDPKSAKHIRRFAEDFNIALDELEKPDLADYKTFNEFFSRKMKSDCRPVASSKDDTIVSSAADCRLSVFPTIDLAQKYWVKGRHFSLEALFGDAAMAQKFDGGSLGIFRLAPQDYHRWHVPVAGTLSPSNKIPGTYYTVSPKAVKEHLDVYTENARTVSTLASPKFGDVAIVAIGAMLVGSIVHTAQPGAVLERGEEMGYFEFGGSTVLVLFRKGVMAWDEDLVHRSQLGMETLVRLGEKIGAAATHQNKV